MKMKRVFLKLSGEALAGPKKTGFDEDTVKEVARQVKLSVDAVYRLESSLTGVISGEAVPVRPLTGPRRTRLVCWPLL